jgi:PAS domain S-box-containing protein
MQSLRNISIQRKQMLIIMFTSGAALVVACVAFATFDILTFRKDMVGELSTHTQIIGNNSTAALDFNDPKGVQETLAALSADSYIRGAAVYTKDGQIFATYGRPNDAEHFSAPPVQAPGFRWTSRALLMFRPIMRKGDVLGTVFVESDLRALYARLEKYALIALAVLCAAGLVAYVLSSRLQRLVSIPILSLVETARSVAREQNYSKRAVRQSGDELGILVDSFNEMLVQIQQRDGQLQKAKDLLEERVEERTRELQERTQELHREVLHHKRTEEALAISERLMVSLVETLPQNVLRKDLAGKFTFVNSFFCGTVGKSKSEILGKTDFDLFPPDLASKFHHDDERVIASGQQFETEEESQNFGGEKNYVQVIKTPLYDVEHKPIGLQVIFWDVTARKQAEQALRAQEERTRSIIDKAFDSIVTTDVDARIIGWNRQAAATFGWAPDQILGRRLTETLVPLRRRGEHEADFERFRKTGEWRLQNQLFETTGVHQDSREIPIEVSISPIRVGNSYIFNAFIRDISERKQAEAELHAAQKELVDISRQAGMAEVATSVLHNVGNVLNSINVTATLVDERVRKSRSSDLNRLLKLLGEHAGDLGTFFTVDPRGRKVPEFLGHLAERLAAEQALVLAELASLRKNVEHVKDIVAMQQSYAKISGVTETVEVSELVEDTLRMNAAALARHEVRVVREYCPLPPITTDKHKVLQILINLVRNAKYACDESERSDKCVTVRVSDGNGRVKISVTDNGIGIQPENLTRIFNHGFTTRKAGHGFGLHSGALAAKELGGVLTAQSDGPDKGATFTLELPKTRPPSRSSPEQTNEQT